MTESYLMQVGDIKSRGFTFPKRIFSRLRTFLPLSPFGINKHVLYLPVHTQPPTVVRKIGSSVGICTRCVHVFFARFAGRFVCSVCACQQKLLHRSSGGSLLRVRCWLGCSTVPNFYEMSSLSHPCFVSPTDFALASLFLEDSVKSRHTHTPRTP